jgi:hypothetical protein
MSLDDLVGITAALGGVVVLKDGNRVYEKGEDCFGISWILFLISE